jgi:hypothetical protein
MYFNPVFMAQILLLSFSLLVLAFSFRTKPPAHFTS